MNIFKISSPVEYLEHLKNNAAEIELLNAISDELNAKITHTSKFFVSGYSWTAQSKSKFLVDNNYSSNGLINFRERLVCSKTKLNNRIRGSIHIFESLFKPQLNDCIYLTEQNSLLARWMKRKYRALKCSEYLNECSVFEKLKLAIRLFPDKISHQDLTQLSFENHSFNHVLSFDCFEHIPNYTIALQEIYRTLKVNGNFLFSVPFDLNQKNNLVRASLINDAITHHTEPEYHGDPVSKNGCLSYYTFGWQLLQELTEIGFRNVHILLYSSEKYAYLGEEQMIICAQK